MWFLPHFSDTNKLRVLRVSLFWSSMKRTSSLATSQLTSTNPVIWKHFIPGTELLPFLIGLQDLLDVAWMHDTAWSCPFTLRDLVSLYRSGTQFFWLCKSFKNPKIPKSHKIGSDTPTACCHQKGQSCSSLLLLHYTPAASTKTFGEKPKRKNPGKPCCFLLLILFCSVRQNWCPILWVVWI